MRKSDISCVGQQFFLPENWKKMTDFDLNAKMLTIAWPKLDNFDLKI